MDIVTHAVMGAVAALLVTTYHQPPASESTLTRRRGVAAVGALAGVLPDADALIQSGSDALLLLDYHRHFTHALAFVPIGALIGALIAALIASLVLRPVSRKFSWRTLYLASFAGYLPHPLLDACTSYGTYLWLPFSSEKAAWNLLAVIDPVFTLLWAVPLVLALRRTKTKALHWAVALAACYVSLAMVQHYRAESAALALAQSRGHVPSQLSAKPSMANLLLWRSLYHHDGQVQVDAFHLGTSIRHYPGESAPLLDEPKRVQLVAGEGQRATDIERFRAFSDGFLVLDPANPGLIGDARYAMLPTAIAPLWGIRWAGAGAPTEFVSQHAFSPAMRRQFLDMLRGREISVAPF